MSSFPDLKTLRQRVRERTYNFTAGVGSHEYPTPHAQETIITIRRDGVARVFTCMPNYIRRMDTLVAQSPDTVKCVWESKSPIAKEYVMPANRVQLCKDMKMPLNPAPKPVRPAPKIGLDGHPRG